MSQPDWLGVAGGLVPTPQVLAQSRDALHRDGHPRRDGDAAQPLPAFVDRADARMESRSDADKHQAIKYATIDSSVALSLAFFVNAAILVVAAAAFHRAGRLDVADIRDAYLLLSPLLGVSVASTLFALALLASGTASTLTATLAGQIVMEGFIHIRLPAWLRRLVTRLLALVPALITIVYFGESSTGSLLVLSQVVLSLQLSFAVIPLVIFTSDPKRDGRVRQSEMVDGRCRGSSASSSPRSTRWLLIQTFQRRCFRLSQHRMPAVSLDSAFETPQAKRQHVRTLFATIADRYDLITAVLSYGQDARWKAKLVSIADVRAGERALDLAAGTGDIAFAVAARGAKTVGARHHPSHAAARAGESSQAPARSSRWRSSPAT